MKQVKVRKNGYVLDLSCAGELTRRAIRDWMESGHTLDKKLLLECAYYPRGGCQGCTFDNPNKNCDKSHILHLEIQDPKFASHSATGSTNRRPSEPPKATKLTAWGMDLTRIWATLPEEAKAEILKTIKS